MTDQRRYRYAKRRLALFGQGAGAPSAPDRRARAGTGDASQLPLLAWSESREPARKRLRKLYVPQTLLALGALALGLTIACPPAPRLMWNASPSVAVGLYLVDPLARLRSGDLVVVRLPKPARMLAARRAYLPANVPAIKRIAAASGAHICARGRAIEIDGRRAASRLAADGQGRPLPWWQGCRRLRAGEIFLLGSARADSFDGRYFGPSPLRDAIGRAQLLWAPGAGTRL